MPLVNVPVNVWTAIPALANGTRVTARGTGFYISTATLAPDVLDFGDAKAVASQESIFIDAAVTTIWAHPSNSVLDVNVYTQDGIVAEDDAH
jgi:hypothetical protein